MVSVLILHLFCLNVICLLQWLDRKKIKKSPEHSFSFVCVQTPGSLKADRLIAINQDIFWLCETHSPTVSDPQTPSWLSDDELLKSHWTEKLVTWHEWKRSFLMPWITWERQMSTTAGEEKSSTARSDFFFFFFYSSVLIPAPSYSHYVFFQVKRDVNEQPRPNFQDSSKTVNLSQVLLRHLEPSGHPSWITTRWFVVWRISQVVANTLEASWIPSLPSPHFVFSEKPTRVSLTGCKRPS